MACRIVIFWTFLIFAFIPPVYATVTVEVKVKGVESQLHDNVMARLTLYLQRNSERLQPGMVRRLHNQASEDIRTALAPFGYYHPKVKSSLARKDGGYIAEYEIEKGDPVKIDKISIELAGEGKYHRRLMQAVDKFPLKIGDVLNQQLYERGKRDLARLAYGEGFLDAVFAKRALRIDRGANLASIELELDTKRQYRFGNTYTIDDVIEQNLLERYFPFQPGDPYNPAKLFELQSILYKTDYFSRVEVRGQPDLADDLMIPVKIELAAPEKLNKYSFGLGYGTDTGARGKVDWSNRLFNSRGHKISGSMQVAERRAWCHCGMTYRGAPIPVTIKSCTMWLTRIRNGKTLPLNYSLLLFRGSIPGPVLNLAQAVKSVMKFMILEIPAAIPRYLSRR